MADRGPERIGQPTRGGIAAALANAAAGTKTSGRLHVGTMASGQEIALPYLVAKGGRGGRCLWVNAAVHGDEINGVLAAIDFFTALDAAVLTGAVVVTPVSNPLALDARRKRVPQDEQDLDQAFPGRAGGLTSQILAAALFDEIRVLADIVINFHTMTPYFASLPYAVYKDHSASSITERDLLAKIACFSPFVACRMPVEDAGQELPGNISGALDYQCLQRGKLAFMVELGGGSRQEPEFIRAGVDGLFRLAAGAGLLPEGEEPCKSRLCRVTSRTHVPARAGGFFRQGTAPGRRLRAGEPLGHVHSVAGDVVETVAFDRDVLVIGLRSDPVVHSGDRVGFVALEWEEVDV